MLGAWDKSAADLRLSVKIDFSEDAQEVLNYVQPKVSYSIAANR